MCVCVCVTAILFVCMHVHVYVYECMSLELSDTLKGSLVRTLREVRSVGGPDGSVYVCTQVCLYASALS